MARVYKRKFDWHEAKRLRGEGLSYRQISARLGVSEKAVARACDIQLRARQDATTYAWVRRGKCPDCGAQTTRLRVGGDHRCKVCAAIALATTAREAELLCCTCREWKPDDDFPRSAAEKYGRRGRHSQCRSCLTLAKREWRARNREKQREYDRERKRRLREAA